MYRKTNNGALTNSSINCNDFSLQRFLIQNHLKPPITDKKEIRQKTQPETLQDLS